MKGKYIMKKDKYLTPEFEIIRFDSEDVITASGIHDEVDPDYIED